MSLKTQAHNSRIEIQASCLELRLKRMLIDNFIYLLDCTGVDLAHVGSGYFQIYIEDQMILAMFEDENICIWAEHSEDTNGVFTIVRKLFVAVSTTPSNYETAMLTAREVTSKKQIDDYIKKVAV